MAGRGQTVETLAGYRVKNGKPRGLYERLASHASGRRSGDQFCVYVADRFVLPALTTDEIRSIAAGEHGMDAFVRRFIHAELGYRCVETPDGGAALALERRLIDGELGQLPLLNPRD
jgi:hypothetical protein